MRNASHAHSQLSLYEWSWLSVPSGKIAFDAQSGAIIDVNPNAEKLTGYSHKELLGMHIGRLHPEEERARIAAEYLQPNKDAVPHPGLHLLRKDGRRVPLRSFTSKAIELEGRAVVVVDCRDVSDRVEHEHKLAAQNWALKAYASSAFALGGMHTSEDQLLQSICEAITGESEYPLAWIGIAEDVPGKPIRIAAAAGSAVEYLKDAQLSWSEDVPVGRGPTGTCIRSQQEQIVEDTETSSIYAPWRELGQQYGLRSCVSIPLSIDGGWRGMLAVYAGQVNAFEPIAMDVFRHLARQIAFGVRAIDQEKKLQSERQRASVMQKQLTEALSAMVEPIVLAMEMRDPYTAGHQSRVAEIACAIGRRMGWTEDRLQGLSIAAKVHDIGKISIPAEILTKPGKLNDAERAMIRQHSETAYTILKDIPFPWPIAEIVRQHHEKIDGSGYPLGLKGDEILPESKVLTVADIVEAMTCYRPYRPGIKLHLVLQQIEKDAGIQLDAEVVRVCLDLFRNQHFVLPGGSND
jgi:PAS domain S-box-containing protein